MFPLSLLLESLKDIAPLQRLRKRRLRQVPAEGSQDQASAAGAAQVSVVANGKGKHILMCGVRYRKSSFQDLLPSLWYTYVFSPSCAQIWIMGTGILLCESWWWFQSKMVHWAISCFPVPSSDRANVQCGMGQRLELFKILHLYLVSGRKIMSNTKGSQQNISWGEKMVQDAGNMLRRIGVSSPSSCGGVISRCCP